LVVSALVDPADWYSDNRCILGAGEKYLDNGWRVNSYPHLDVILFVILAPIDEALLPTNAKFY